MCESIHFEHRRAIGHTDHSLSGTHASVTFYLDLYFEILRRIPFSVRDNFWHVNLTKLCCAVFWQHDLDLFGTRTIQGLCLSADTFT